MLKDIRDRRLMQFTSLLRTLNVVSNARVSQCLGHWQDFENMYPMTVDRMNEPLSNDHKNMIDYIKDNFKVD